MESSNNNDSDYEIVEKQSVLLERVLQARMLEVAYHESFYEVKRKINVIENSKKTTLEKNIEKQALAKIMESIFNMKRDVNTLIYSDRNITEISQKVIDIETQRFLNSGMSLSQLKQSLDTRLKI